MQATSYTLLDLIQAGGPIMYVLLALSIVSLATAIERSLNFRPKRILDQTLVAKARSLWKTGQHDQLDKLCGESPATLAARAIKLANSHRARPFDEVNLAVSDCVSAQMRLHLHRAYPLSVVATLAPLLGLLGTVLGMISAFQSIAASGDAGDASIVASGISLALSTTAAGLLVGVPSLALKHFFNSRIQSAALALEEELNTFLNETLLARTQLQSTEIPTPSPNSKPASQSPR